MKKILGIVIIILFCAEISYAKKIKPGSSSLEFDDLKVEIFHEYLTEKFSRESFKERLIPGHHFGTLFCKPCRDTYSHYFLILTQDDEIPMVLNYGVKGWNKNPGWNVQWSKDLHSVGAKIFAKKNKIVWKGAKKKISRDVTLEDLKDILRELGFYK